MALRADERTPGSSGRLDDRVLDALQGLPGRMAFSGLRRVLGAHPESLARSLRRLEREGLVERVDGGYRALAGVERSVDELTSDLRPVAQVDLPVGTSAETLLGRLAGRWFGALRWVGVVERPDGRLLSWARRDGSGHVLLGIDRGTLRVYRPGGAPDDEPAETEDAAYELLVHAVEALRPTPGATEHVTFLRREGSSDAPFWGEN
jgi:DNA-binding HxlR family transcriptional regulator